jgi:ABC-type Zn uptake system ZnuABC Zn-binding protein ZnuA
MGVKLLIMEPNRPRKTAQQLAQAVNARLLVLPLMPGGHPQATGFFEWMDYNMSQIEAALKP